MNQERRTKIAAALQQYRDTVSQHNMNLIRAVVKAMKTKPIPPNWSENDAELPRQRELCRLLRTKLPESVMKLQDLVDDDDVLASLIQHNYLDGISPSPIKQEQRDEWFATIRTRMPENVELDEFPPADLAYLCTLVNGITGPGLSYFRDAEQYTFISPIYKDAKELEKRLSGVVVPIRGVEDDEPYRPPHPLDSGVKYNQLTDIWTEWEIAVSFHIGSDGPGAGGSYALYCRPEKDHDEPFKWRYGTHDEEWASDVYDSVEEFLGFYAHFKEQTEQEIIKAIRPLVGSYRNP